MSKNIDEMLCELCDFANNSQNSNINYVFKKVFEEQNEVGLLLKRAIVIEHCERVLKELDYDENYFEDIYKALTFHNLNAEIKHISPFLTKTHKRMIESTFKHYKSIKKIHEVDEIVDLSEDLKSDIESEDLTEPQRVLMYEICEAVENAKQEHDIVGNSAIKKLQEILIGKLFLYKDEIKNIKSEVIKEKLSKVYQKVVEVNKIMGFVLSLKNNTINFLEMLGFMN
ncbi:hypothetical protein [Aliarcobacter butzleri]|uniref:hypothetical protein n=1 Tax=Aliarcobacter butzleri TaxID=28197 RepID=UPI001EDBC969|nr:hypothetical protein [Aliarcobacter butzleri]MCG3671957.1 hypothetical protein [Aliarcobacter butzleri]